MNLKMATIIILEYPGENKTVASINNNDRSVNQNLNDSDSNNNKSF